MATWSCHLEMIKGDCLIRKCKIGAVTPDPNEWMNGGGKATLARRVFPPLAPVQKVLIGGNKHPRLLICRHYSPSQILVFKMQKLQDERGEVSRDSWVTGDEID